MSQTNTVLDDELIETIGENDDLLRETADEEFVITSSVSQDRVQSFLAGYFRDRVKAATAENLFDRANAFEGRDEWREDRAYGFNVLLHKGPFVEGSRWLPYRTWEFATAAERHVMRRLERVFRAALPAEDSGAVPRIAGRIVQELERLFEGLRGEGKQPSMVAFAGDVGTDTLVDLFSYITPRWHSSMDGDLPWIIGAFRELPILQFPAATDPAIYVADLQGLGTFVRYGSTPRFSLTEFDEARAAEVIARTPNVIAIPSGRPDTRDERIRQLRLHVSLKLYECNEILVKDQGAVLGVRLEQGDVTTLETVIGEVQRQQSDARERGWRFLRLELGSKPYRLVREANPDGHLRVDGVEWDVVEGSSRNGIHLIAHDAQGVAHRL